MLREFSKRIRRGDRILVHASTSSNPRHLFVSYPVIPSSRSVKTVNRLIYCFQLRKKVRSSAGSLLSYVERLSLLKAFYIKFSTLRLVVDTACQWQPGNSLLYGFPCLITMVTHLLKALIVDDEINGAFAFDGYRELRPQLGENITSVSTYSLRVWVAR